MKMQTGRNVPPSCGWLWHAPLLLFFVCFAFPSLVHAETFSLNNNNMMMIKMNNNMS